MFYLQCMIGLKFIKITSKKGQIQMYINYVYRYYLFLIENEIWTFQTYMLYILHVDDR